MRPRASYNSRLNKQLNLNLNFIGNADNACRMKLCLCIAAHFNFNKLSKKWGNVNDQTIILQGSLKYVGKGTNILNNTLNFELL